MFFKFPKILIEFLGNLRKIIDNIFSAGDLGLSNGRYREKNLIINYRRNACKMVNYASMFVKYMYLSMIRCAEHVKQVTASPIRWIFPYDTKPFVKIDFQLYNLKL